MSKTKDAAIEQQNAAAQEQAGAASSVAGDAIAAQFKPTALLLDVKATVAEGYAVTGTQTRPAIYVQSDTRLVVVADTEQDVQTVTDAALKALSKKGAGITARPSAIYGSTTATDRIWQEIEIEYISNN